MAGMAREAASCVGNVLCQQKLAIHCKLCVEYNITCSQFSKNQTA